MDSERSSSTIASRRHSEAGLQTLETRLLNADTMVLHDDVGLIVGQVLHAPIGDEPLPFGLTSSVPV